VKPNTPPNSSLQVEILWPAHLTSNYAVHDAVIVQAPETTEPNTQTSEATGGAGIESAILVIAGFSLAFIAIGRKVISSEHPWLDDQKIQEKTNR
jgi:hypothetical protein